MSRANRWLHAMQRIVLAVAVLLGFGLAAAWFQPDGSLRNTHWVPPAPIRPDFALPAGAGGAPADGAYDTVAILERPVFAPNRKPAPVLTAAGDVPAPPPDALDSLRLFGVFAGATQGVLAQVDGKPRRVLVNQAVGGWTLRSVKDRDVTFVRGDTTRVVKLARPKANAPAGGVAAGAAPAPAVALPAGMPPSVAAREAASRAEDEERQRRVDAVLKAAGLPPQRR